MQAWVLLCCSHQSQALTWCFTLYEIELRVIEVTNYELILTIPVLLVIAKGAPG